MHFLTQIIDSIKSWFNGSSDSVVRPTRYNKSRVQSTKTKATKSKSARSQSSRSRSTTSKPKAAPKKRSSTTSRKKSSATPDRRRPANPKTKKAGPKSNVTAKRKVVKKKAPAKKKSSSAGRTAKSASKKTADSPMVGEVTHYFSRIKVCVVKVTKASIKVGDRINIKGSQTDNIEKIESLQIESVEVKSAKRGQMVGVKLKKPVRVGDKVFRLA